MSIHAEIENLNDDGIDVTAHRNEIENRLNSIHTCTLADAVNEYDPTYTTGIEYLNTLWEIGDGIDLGMFSLGVFDVWASWQLENMAMEMGIFSDPDVRESMWETICFVYLSYGVGEYAAYGDVS